MTSEINLQRNNNYYWSNGAYCENCGILTGNVTNNGVQPIWHEGCKPGCKSVWHDQSLDTTSDHQEDQRHPYHEDTEELELEAQEEYRREMEAQEREENAMEERDRIECGYGRSYYDCDDDDERD